MVQAAGRPQRVQHARQLGSITLRQRGSMKCGRRNWATPAPVPAGPGRLRGRGGGSAGRAPARSRRGRRGPAASRWSGRSGRPRGSRISAMPATVARSGCSPTRPERCSVGAHLDRPEQVDQPGGGPAEVPPVRAERQAEHLGRGLLARRRPHRYVRSSTRRSGSPFGSSPSRAIPASSERRAGPGPSAVPASGSAASRSGRLSSRSAARTASSKASRPERRRPQQLGRRRPGVAGQLPPSGQLQEVLQRQPPPVPPVHGHVVAVERAPGPARRSRGTRRTAPEVLGPGAVRPRVAYGGPRRLPLEEFLELTGRRGKDRRDRAAPARAAAAGAAGRGAPSRRRSGPRW